MPLDPGPVLALWRTRPCVIMSRYSGENHDASPDDAADTQHHQIKGGEDAPAEGGSPGFRALWGPMMQPTPSTTRSKAERTRLQGGSAQGLGLRALHTGEVRGSAAHRKSAPLPRVRSGVSSVPHVCSTGRPVILLLEAPDSEGLPPEQHPGLSTAQHAPPLPSG